VVLRYASGQTDRQTDTLIAVLGEIISHFKELTAVCVCVCEAAGEWQVTGLVSGAVSQRAVWNASQVDARSVSHAELRCLSDER